MLLVVASAARDAAELQLEPAAHTKSIFGNAGSFAAVLAKTVPERLTLKVETW